MPAIELVMCRRCGRPQSPAEKCIQCGEKLPEAVAAQAQRSAPDAVLDPYAPHLELSVGGGRALAVSQKRLEWLDAPGKKPLQIELSSVAHVRFRSRPTWEALLLAGLFALAGFAWRGLWLQGAFIALAAVAVLACYLQRRYALVVVWKDGTRRALFFGAGTRSSPASERVRSAWDTLSTELANLGVKVLR